MKSLFRLASVVCLHAVVLMAQPSATHLPSHGASLNFSSAGYSTGKAGAKSALVSRTDMVFPHLAVGGGWETTLVLVNMSDRIIDFRVHFFDPTGKPLGLPFRNSQGVLDTAPAMSARLATGGTLNVLLSDPQGATKIGWAALDYDPTSARLGGFAVFRQRVQGRVAVPEALVPLSPYDDDVFVMPFDNTQGADTAMALVNPASALENVVRFLFLNPDSSIIGTGEMTLPPSGHRAFVLREQFPDLNLSGKLGSVLVESNLNRLSALGLRFNESGTFSSIPVMNW